MPDRWHEVLSRPGPTGTEGASVTARRAAVSPPMMVRNITAEVYATIAPELGVHSLCREVACIGAGVAAALGIEATLVFDPDYVERGDRSPHFWLQLADGSKVDAWQSRDVRLRPAA
jgi:hypothetical protein